MTKLYLYVCRYLTVFLLCSATLAFAQEKKVTGKVSSADDGSGLPGVNVLEKGTGNGAVTDADGNYTLNVGANATLVFSFVGYKNQEVAVGNQTTIDVRLENDVTALSEVVVVGYGTSKQKDLTGSIATVSSESFNKGVISTPEQLLSGRTPGVNIIPSSGEPGAASVINIRGTSSIRGNNDPLYVIDGVPLDNSTGTSATQSGIEGTSTPKNPLLFLNPNDIESITVLKDAASAAIYGSRGANGVVLVTTKSGKGSGKKGSFNFTTYVSVSNPAKKYDLLSGPDFLKGVEAANIAAGTSPAAAAIAVAGAPVNNGANTDWQKQVYRSAIANGYNLSWGMQNGGTALRISGNIESQQGILKNSDMNRMSLRVNYTQKFMNDKLKLDIATTVSNVKDSYAPNTNNAGYQGSLVGAMISANPTNPIYNPNGSGLFFDLGDGNRNPAAMLAYFDDKDNINRILSNLSLSYELSKGLVFKTTYGYNNSNSLRKSFADPRVPSSWNLGPTDPASTNGTSFGIKNDYNNGITGNGRAVYQHLSTLSVLTESTLTYDKTFGSSVLNAVGGYSYQTFESNNFGDVAWGVKSPVVNATDQFVKDIDAFTNKAAAYLPQYTKSSLQSFFARVNYSINDKYFLTGTVRADGSSKFGANNKYGTFPAAAVRWKLFKEGFAADNIGKAFADFSIRANYGTIGSQDGLDPYSAVNLQQTMTSPKGTTATIFDHQENKKLKWEVATTTGAGLDWALANNRLAGTIDYFHTERSNLISFGPVPGGFSASNNYYFNLPGKVINTGLEFSFKYEAIVTGKFNWNIAYNMTFYHNNVQGTNKIYNTGAVSGQGLSGAYAQVIQDGHSLFSWSMPVFNGYDANGYAIYADGSKNHIVGSALPTFTSGLTNNFSYGNWNLSVFFAQQSGNYVYNNTANALFLKGSLKTAHNVTYAAANSNESPINPGSVSTRFLEKGDFIRLQNAQLSYNFKVTGKVIRSLSANIAGQNLWLITNYTGLDPLVNVDKNINNIPSRGFDYAGYPKPRTFTVGLNVGF